MGHCLLADLQFAYEFCIRKNNVSTCIVEESVVDSLFNDFAEYGAGFLAPDRTFLDHEWFKHGTCESAGVAGSGAPEYGS